MRSFKPPLSGGRRSALFIPFPPFLGEILEYIAGCFGVEHILDVWSWLSPAGTDLVK